MDLLGLSALVEKVEEALGKHGKPAMRALYVTLYLTVFYLLLKTLWGGWTTINELRQGDSTVLHILYYVIVMILWIAIGMGVSEIVVRRHARRLKAERETIVSDIEAKSNEVFARSEERVEKAHAWYDKAEALREETHSLIEAHKDKIRKVEDEVNKLNKEINKVSGDESS